MAASIIVFFLNFIIKGYNMLQLRKNLRDQFAMALEEMENIDGGEIVAKTEEEMKILEEEALKSGIEIQQDIEAIEECCGDIETLQEQLGENDKKLTDPDIVVTAVDVEVSEECYKGMAFKHGIRNVNAIRFSQESVLDAVKEQPRKYLTMSTEGIKDMIIKIWEKIKAFFRKIGEKLGILEKVEAAKSKKSEEKLKETKKELEALPEKVKKTKIRVLKPKKSKKKVSTESYSFYLSKEEVTDDDIERSAIGCIWTIFALAEGRKDVFTEMTNAKRITGLMKSAVKHLGDMQKKLANGADPDKDKEVILSAKKASDAMNSTYKATSKFISKYAKYLKCIEGNDSSARIAVTIAMDTLAVHGTDIDCFNMERFENAIDSSESASELPYLLYSLPTENMDALAKEIEPTEKMEIGMLQEYINILDKTKYDDYRNEINSIKKEIDTIVSDANVNFSPNSKVGYSMRAIASILKTIVKHSVYVSKENRYVKDYFGLLAKYAKEIGADQ